MENALNQHNAENVPYHKEIFVGTFRIISIIGDKR